MMTKDFLLEINTEELPVKDVGLALDKMRHAFLRELKSHRIKHTGRVIEDRGTKKRFRPEEVKRGRGESYVHKLILDEAICQKMIREYYDLYS